MGKKGFVLFLILISTLCLYAEVEKPRLLIGSGNDKFTYGISKNADDQLSFSGFIAFYYDKYAVDVSVNAYTDRGTWYDGVFRNGRIDEILVDARYFKEYDINDYMTFEVNPTIGVCMTGNFGLEFIQNKDHSGKGIPAVLVPYDWDYVQTSPVFGIEFGYGVDIEYINFRLAADYRMMTNFVSTKLAELKITVLDFCSLSAGYQRETNFSESLTMDSVVDSQKGYVFKMDLDINPMVLDWTYCPESKFGYGTICFDALEFFRPTKWKQSEFFIDMNLSELYDMELLNASARIPIGEKLSYICGISYVSGFPKATVTSQQRVQRNYALFEMGLYYRPIQWFVSPYIQAQIGGGYFQIDYLNNTNPARHIDDVSLPGKVAFVGDLRLGLEIFPEGMISFGKTAYKLQVFGGSHIVPQNEKLTSVLVKDFEHSENWKAKAFDPYLGVGISVGIDVPN